MSSPADDERGTQTFLLTAARSRALAQTVEVRIRASSEQRRQSERDARQHRERDGKEQHPNVH